MIQPNELRLGNLVSHTNEKDTFIVRIIGIRQDDHSYATVEYRKGSWGLDYEDLQPIPLTPEILEKCGFTRMNWEVLAYTLGMGNGFEFCTSINDINTIRLIHEDSFLGLYIHSLHHLQNVYFALAGKELTVNL